DDPLGTSEDGAVELLARRLAALLRVVQAGERPDLVVAQLRVVEQYARHQKRPRERPAARLVGAGDEAHAELAVELEKLASGTAARHAGEHSAALSGRPKT